MRFRIIPVIDLKGGVPVHAVGGRREQYQPLRSVWQATASPAALAMSMREGLGIDCIYVADLDAIEGRPPHRGAVEDLVHDRFEVWLDAGVRDRRSAEGGIDGVRIVVGLESLAGPSELAAIVERAGRDRVIFSLDLDDGRPRMAGGAAWGSMEPLAIVVEAVEAGIRRLILLDLARVGTGRGIGTEALMPGIRGLYPEVEIAVGGGISGVEDVLESRRRGASGVLIGSAIHDGRIGRRELERIAEATGGIA